jgi:hypothetical protein
VSNLAQLAESIALVGLDEFFRKYCFQIRQKQERESVRSLSAVLGWLV